MTLRAILLIFAALTFGTGAWANSDESAPDPSRLLTGNYVSPVAADGIKTIDLSAPFTRGGKIGLIGGGGSGKSTITILSGPRGGAILTGQDGGDGDVYWNSDEGWIKIRDAKAGRWVDLRKFGMAARVFGGGNSEIGNAIDEKLLKVMREAEAKYANLPKAQRNAILGQIAASLGLDEDWRKQSAPTGDLAYNVDRGETVSIKGHDSMRVQGVRSDGTPGVNILAIDPELIDGGVAWVAGLVRLNALHKDIMGRELPPESIPATVDRLRAVIVRYENLATGESYEMSDYGAVTIDKAMITPK